MRTIVSCVILSTVYGALWWVLSDMFSSFGLNVALSITISTMACSFLLLLSKVLFDVIEDIRIKIRLKKFLDLNHISAGSDTGTCIRKITDE